MPYTFLPSLIFTIMIVIAFIIAKRLKSFTGYFYMLYFVSLLLSLLFGTTGLISLVIFSPILSQPVYSCWIKPTKKLAWRAASIGSLILSVVSSHFVLSYSSFSFPQFFLLSILIPLLVMLPITTVSFFDWKMRKKIVEG